MSSSSPAGRGPATTVFIAWSGQLGARPLTVGLEMLRTWRACYGLIGGSGRQHQARANGHSLSPSGTPEIKRALLAGGEPPGLRGCQPSVWRRRECGMSLVRRASTNRPSSAEPNSLRPRAAPLPTPSGPSRKQRHQACLGPIPGWRRPSPVGRAVRARPFAPARPAQPR